MPKRVATPPPGDDEPKFFSINYPYPAYADLECNKEDRKLVAQWISCCVPKRQLFALYHKPTAPNTIIAEIDRDCREIDNFLGEHRWAEFLKSVPADQEDMKSRVFYCAFSTGREVQKLGWKRLDIDDKWFVNFEPKRNKTFAFPYPTSHYCEYPIRHNQVGYKLCRPLPKKLFPAPKKTDKPSIVVGSPAWLELKSNENRVQKVRQAIAAQQPKSWADIASDRISDDTPSVAPTKDGEPRRFPSSSDNSSEYSVEIVGGFATGDRDSSQYNPSSASSIQDMKSETTGSAISIVFDDSDEEEAGLPRLADVVSILPASGGNGAIASMPLDVSGVAVTDDNWEVKVSELTIEERVKTPEAAPVYVNLWADVEPVPLNKGARDDHMECREHGRACKSGICAEVYKQKKELERQKRAQGQGDGKSESWRNKGQGKGRGGPTGRDRNNSSRSTSVASNTTSNSSGSSMHGSSRRGQAWRNKHTSGAWTQAATMSQNGDAEEQDDWMPSSSKSRSRASSSSIKSSTVTQNVKSPNSSVRDFGSGSMGRAPTGTSREWGDAPIYDPIEAYEGPEEGSVINEEAEEAEDTGGWW